jgi:hypothetical protein
MGIELTMSANRRSAENRLVPRYRFRGEATVRRLESDPTLPGQLLELSTHGCLLRLPDLSEFAVGTFIDLYIDTGKVAFRALGSIRHRAHTRRVLGISFLHLSRRGEADLFALIDDLGSAPPSARPVLQEITVSRHHSSGTAVP